jgi:hypothetical protein
MTALSVRELIIAARRAGVPVTALTVLALLTAFVLTWSPGVDVLAPMSFYEQTRALHWLLLAGALPWLAIRCSPRDRRDAGVMALALLALPPSAVIRAKIVASFAILVAVALTGVPALVMAQQVAADPMTRVVVDLLPLAGFAFLIATLATAAMLHTADGLRAWLWTWGLVAAILVATMSVVTEVASVGLVCVAAGIIVRGYLQMTAGRFFTYSGGADAR